MKHEHNGEPCFCNHDHSEHHKHHPHQVVPCACGHDHDDHKDHEHHHHQHPKLDHGDLAITHHENAIIISAEREISGDYLLIKDTLALGLKELADWVESQDGLVGHIKGHLTEKAKSAMLSTTGDGVQIKEAHHPVVILNLAVIVFVADEASLANQVLTMIAKLNQSKKRL